MSALTRAAMPAAPQRGHRQEIAAAAADISGLIRQLRRDPGRYRDVLCQLAMMNERLGLLEEALGRHDKLIAEALGLAGEPVLPVPAIPAAAPQAARPALRLLRGMKALVPAAGLAALGSVARAHRRATSGALASMVLAGGVAGGAVLTVQHQPYVSVPRVTAHAAVAPARTAAPLAASAPGNRPHHRKRHPPRSRVVPPAAAPKPEPRRVPSPSASATPVPQGVITVRSGLIQARPGQTVTIVLTATGGPAVWTATATGGVILRQDHGYLAAGGSVLIAVTVDGTGTISIRPGGTAIQVVAT